MLTQPHCLVRGTVLVSGCLALLAGTTLAQSETVIEPEHFVSDADLMERLRDAVQRRDQAALNALIDVSMKSPNGMLEFYQLADEFLNTESFDDAEFMYRARLDTAKTQSDRAGAHSNLSSLARRRGDTATAMKHAIASVDEWRDGEGDPHAYYMYNPAAISVNMLLSLCEQTDDFATGIDYSGWFLGTDLSLADVDVLSSIYASRIRLLIASGDRAAAAETVEAYLSHLEAHGFEHESEVLLRKRLVDLRFERRSTARRDAYWELIDRGGFEDQQVHYQMYRIANTLGEMFGTAPEVLVERSEDLLATLKRRCDAPDIAVLCRGSFLDDLIVFTLVQYHSCERPNEERMEELAVELYQLRHPDHMLDVNRVASTRSYVRQVLASLGTDAPGLRGTIYTDPDHDELE
ncbi:MAG: hypothetical protein AAGG07_07960 [Planctomycetota bacterium]